VSANLNLVNIFDFGRLFVSPKRLLIVRAVIILIHNQWPGGAREGGANCQPNMKINEIQES
jgi:hypothetical protein